MKTPKRSAHDGESGSRSTVRTGESDEDSRRRRLHLVSSKALPSDLQLLPVEIPIGSLMVRATLYLPSDCRGVVLYASVEGLQSRRFPEPQMNEAFNKANLATVVLPVAEGGEEPLSVLPGEYHSGIVLMAQQLKQITRWAAMQPQLEDLKIGLFASGVGAAAALHVAAELGYEVSALALQDGRLDLAGSALPRVQAATLCLELGEDAGEFEVSRHAMNDMICEKRLTVISGDTQDPASKEEVIKLARQWFEWHLGVRQDQIQIE